jgi:hypothetical protein
MWKAVFVAGLIALCAQPASAQSADFNRYAVTKYEGPKADPDFSGSGARFRTYRSAISFDYSRGWRLTAGHFLQVRVGCGMQCLTYYFVDVRNGQILEFPIAGERYLELALNTTPESRLIVAKWIDPSDPLDQLHHCIVRNYLLEGIRFVQIGKDAVLTRGCDNF